jgi:hypothetical protein
VPWLHRTFRATDEAIMLFFVGWVDSGKPASGHTPCDLLLEYLDHVKEFPTPMRMVKGHTHSLLGAWFKEHWDLRDRLNVDKNISTEKIREIAVELKQRIIACGRDHPVPRLTERAIARREEQLRKVRGSPARTHASVRAERLRPLHTQDGRRKSQIVYRQSGSRVRQVTD